MQNSFSARCAIFITVLAALGDIVVALSVGDKTACAIESSTGRLRCWGRGQTASSPVVGDYYSGNTEAEKGDLQVPTDLLTNTFDVVVMKSHVCALKADALDATNGKLLCFKAGDPNSIGMGTLPFKGPGGTQPDLAVTSFVQLSGKGDHVCALDATGQLSCWSEAAFGTGASWGANWDNAGAKHYKSIAVGYDHMCAIARCNATWECFGPPSLIATDNADTTKIPAKHDPNNRILLSKALKSISCGKSYMCGITDANEMLCWGKLDFGTSYPNIDSASYLGPDATELYDADDAGPLPWSKTFEEDGNPVWNDVSSISAGETTLCVVGKQYNSQNIATACLGLSLWAEDTADDFDSEGCGDGSYNCLANFNYDTGSGYDFSEDFDKDLPLISVMSLKTDADVGSMTQQEARYGVAGSFNLNGFINNVKDDDAYYSISRCFAIDPQTTGGENHYSIRCDSFHPYIRHKAVPKDQGWAFGNAMTTEALCEYVAGDNPDQGPFGADSCYGVPPKFLGLNSDWTGTLNNNNMRFKIPSESYQDIICPCEDGYYGTKPTCVACNASDAASVASCEACDGAGIAGCTSGTCDSGFETFVSKTGCSKTSGSCGAGSYEAASTSGCVTCDASDAASVASCEACDGAGIAGCTSGTCASGFEKFVSKTGCTKQESGGSNSGGATGSISPSPSSEKKTLSAATSLSMRVQVIGVLSCVLLALVV